MERFIKNGVYYFDTIYENCKYAVHNNECNCNNGYICSHKDCSEACEENDKLGKCFSFSCPLVADTASRDTIRLSQGEIKEEDINSLNFDNQDFTCDYEEIVVWIGDNNNIKDLVWQNQ